YYEREDGSMSMCKAIKDLIADGRAEGREETMILTATRMLSADKYTLDEISNISGLSIDETNKLHQIENN
ncbi:MAG: hypothetical protein J1E98_11630, partial [Lachnospiraceae bacterium]|nr:hypothetical protein [Lachnospiraceae bacterium]